MSAKIAVLFHQDMKPSSLEYYEIGHMARYWREGGYEVAYLFGPDTSVRADICIVHVDLSVVPDAYIDFAYRFPVVLNGKITDIRKSRLSRYLVTPDCGFDGPVIVKTDLNYAGRPERSLTHNRLTLFAQDVVAPFLRRAGRIVRHHHYRVYDRFSQVPKKYVESEDFVIERYLPEIVDGLRCVNYYKFFGDQHDCARSCSEDAVVVGCNTVRRVDIDVSEEVVDYRKELGIDFGKIDFCLHQGRAVIIDVNKTVGRSRRSNVPLEQVLRRANGIRQYLE